jgi:hypothetical protein
MSNLLKTTILATLAGCATMPAEVVTVNIPVSQACQASVTCTACDAPRKDNVKNYVDDLRRCDEIQKSCISLLVAALQSCKAQ